MKRADFQRQLETDGYSGVEAKHLGPRAPGDMHTHDTDIRGLIEAGSFIIHRAGKAEHHGPGEIFNVSAGDAHSEEITANGVDVVIGRRPA